MPESKPDQIGHSVRVGIGRTIAITTSGGNGWSADYAFGRVYQSIDGLYNIKGVIGGTTTSTVTSQTVSFIDPTTVNFKTGSTSADDMSIACQANEIGVGRQPIKTNRAVRGINDITVETTGTACDEFLFNFDVILKEKPNFI